MTDDKAIEAALDAWFAFGAEKGPGGENWNRMNHALAAADKVRAGKGKRFINERAENVSLKVGIEDLMAENERLRAGLVKGDAERVALVEALKPFAWFASLLPKSVPDYMPLKADLSGSGDLTVAHLRAAALSLVRKGV